VTTDPILNRSNKNESEQEIAEARREEQKRRDEAERRQEKKNK
jgi:hypothetical protein